MFGSAEQMTEQDYDRDLKKEMSRLPNGDSHEYGSSSSNDMPLMVHFRCTSCLYRLGSRVSQLNLFLRSGY